MALSQVDLTRHPQMVCIHSQHPFDDLLGRWEIVDAVSLI
jgi:hypothetical protein